MRFATRHVAPRLNLRRSWGFFVPPANRPVLYVCTTCRRASTAPKPDGVEPDGKQLYDRLAARLKELGARAPARLRPVVCHANCERGCSVAIAAPGKWTYVLGEIGLQDVDDLVTYSATYADAETGVVFRSRRPASLSTVVARFPTHINEAKDAAE